MLRKFIRLSISSSILVLFPLMFFSGCSSDQKSSTSSPPPSPGGPGSGGGSSGGGTSGGSGSGNSGPTVGAYVYVSNTPSANYQYQISAYSADQNGQLTPLVGSPFNDNVAEIVANGAVANGAYLIGETIPQITSTGTISNNFINAYKIGSDGALTQASQTNVNQLENKCATGGGIFFDRPGQTLYQRENLIDCANKGLASFSFDQSSGNLAYLGDAISGKYLGNTISISGNNQFAYSATSGCLYPAFSAFSRSSNGLLSIIPDFKHPAPPAPPPDAPPGSFVTGFVPGQSAADSSNHIVFAEFPCFGQGGPTQTQLATYMIDASGNLSTTDTYATMPTASVLSSTTGKLLISPSEKFLAVADVGGLQIYHFNGANSVTTFTDVLTTDDISEIAWDKKDHLYAITATAPASRNGFLTNANKLYVFTVTDTAATQASGSPYTIAFPTGLAVQSK